MHYYYATRQPNRFKLTQTWFILTGARKCSLYYIL